MQVAHEDALELRLVAVAARGFARLGEDTPRVGKRTQCRVRDRLPLPQVGRVTSDLVKGGQPAEDHALVVGPGGAAVVRARRREPVVDQAVRADQAASAQPLPLPQRPGPVLLVTWCPLMQQRRQRKEQFVGDRVLVSPILVPPQPAATCTVPAALVMREDRPGRAEVPALGGQVVSRHPGQRPPAVIVKEAVDEAGMFELGSRERVPDDPQAGHVPRVLDVPDHRRERVGGVPPAGGHPQAGMRQVPPLQGTNPRLRPGLVIRLCHGPPLAIPGLQSP